MSKNWATTVDPSGAPENFYYATLVFVDDLIR